MTTRSLISRLQDYFSTKPVEKAWLFGSFSRGEQTEDSDVDLIVRFKEGEKIGLKYFSMLSDLEKLCARKVDLAEEDMIDCHVASEVDNQKILIYESQSEMSYDLSTFMKHVIG